MGGQGSSSNSSQGNFYLNAELGSDQHNVFPNNSTRLNVGQSSSSHDTRNHVSFRQLLGDDFRLSPLGDHQAGSTGQNEPTITQGNVREHGLIGTSILPGQTSCAPRRQNLDLNVVADGSGIDASEDDQDNGPELSLDLFAAPGSGHSIRPSGGSSSSRPLMIYSGIAGYVVEENISGDGTVPAEGGRRVLCKRKAPESAASGNSSSSAQQAGNSQHSAVTAQDNTIATNVSSSLTAASSLNSRLNSRHSLGHGAALPTPSNSHQISNQARNVQLIRTTAAAGQQNPTPTNLWTSWNSRYNSNVQTTVFPPLNRFPNTSSAAVPVTPTMQPSQWSGATMSSISPDQSTVNLREAWGREENLRNSRRNMGSMPLANMQANLNLANGNASFVGNIASTSRVQAGSGIHLPSSSMSWSPQPNMSEQYAQRLQDFIVYRSEAWGQGNYCPIHSGMRDMDISFRGGYARAAYIPLISGSRAERQAAATHHSEVSPTVTTAQRRSRLVSEVHSALGLVRRGGVFRLEDVMVIDRSYLFDLPEVPDFDDDMRLDVDNMSYEELLDLEEQIGNVSTGLTEEAILANLRRRKYQSIIPVEPEPCCICQEDYADGEELGKLDCGHDFHFNCIKQWLVQKNSCPICKKTALAI